MPRLALILAVLAVGLVSPTSASAVLAPLTPGQYVPLDGAFQALVPIERNQPGSGLFTSATHACRALDSGDLLLRRFRQACTVKVRMTRELDRFGGCTGPKDCARKARRVRKQVNQLVPRQRALNAVLRVLVLSPCRSALRASRSDLDLLERTGAFMRLLERAVKTQSARLFRRLQRRARVLDRRTAEAPSTASRRTRFQAVCDPRPPV